MTESSNDYSGLFPKQTTSFGIDFYGISSMKHYQVMNKIGEGTFGTVSQALMIERGPRSNVILKKKRVALKKINIRNSKEGFPITALREVVILKRLKHKNIIQLLDLVVEKDPKLLSTATKVKHSFHNFFLVSPYMKSDLSGLLHNPDIIFTEPMIKCLLRQLLEGLNYLHQLKYYHRDIKTANLLLDENGVLKIADFGLARKYYGYCPRVDGGPSEVRAHYTPLVVTRWYRAPEILLGDDKYTTAIDLWGVGCIFAEFFEQSPIMKGKSDLEQLYKIFELVGSPNFDNYPEYNNLSNPLNAEIKSMKPTLRLRFEKYYQDSPSNELRLQLLEKLLSINPQKRINAEQALSHSYFITEPLPLLPKDLPKFAASHEIDNKKFIKEREVRKNEGVVNGPAQQQFNGVNNNNDYLHHHYNNNHHHQSNNHGSLNNNHMIYNRNGIQPTHRPDTTPSWSQNTSISSNNNFTDHRSNNSTNSNWKNPNYSPQGNILRKPSTNNSRVSAPGRFYRINGPSMFNHSSSGSQKRSMEHNNNDTKRKKY